MPAAKLIHAHVFRLHENTVRKSHISRSETSHGLKCKLLAPGKTFPQHVSDNFSQIPLAAHSLSYAPATLAFAVFSHRPNMLLSVQVQAIFFIWKLLHNPSPLRWLLPRHHLEFNCNATCSEVSLDLNFRNRFQSLSFLVGLLPNMHPLL